MKRMLLGFIMMLALVILSGIVLANDVSIMKNQVQPMDNETISAYRIDQQNRIQNRDGINKFYRVYNRNDLVDGDQYFYANGINEQYKTIRL